jgi:hypothetical protein
MANLTVPYGTLPTIRMIHIQDNQVVFVLQDTAELKRASDFPAESPTGIWLQSIEDDLLRTHLDLYHGYGCPLDGTLMTSRCQACEDAQTAF